MTSTQRFKMLAAAIVSAGAITGAQAVPKVFYGFDGDANGTVPPSGNAVAWRQEFLDAMLGTQTESFESFAPGVHSSLSLLGGVATLTQAGTAGRIENVTSSGGFDPGRFNTTPGGDRWWQSTSAFAIEFTTAISGFGMFLTDLGDFRGVLHLDMFDVGGALLATRTVDPDDADNGSLAFFGFTDSDLAIRSIGVRVAQMQGLPSDEYDVVGFDDFIAGQAAAQPPGTVSSPGSLALASLSLVLLAAARRKPRD